MTYYIIHDGQEEGPFELLSMIRKIKNGSITADTLVREEGKEPAPAGSIASLAELFHEEPKEQVQKPSNRQYDLKQVFSNGWHFVSMNYITIIVTGVFLIMALVGAVMFSKLAYLGIAFTFVLLYLLLASYQYWILKRVRGQAFYISDLIEVVQHNLLPLILAGLVLSVPVCLGMLLLLAPGLLILTLYIFTPLIIIEQRRGFWESMEISRKTVMGMGSNNLGVLFALVVANLIGAVFIVLPLLVILPMTMSAVAEIFDEQFNRV